MRESAGQRLGAAPAGSHRWRGVGALEQGWGAEVEIGYREAVGLAGRCLGRGRVPLCVTVSVECWAWRGDGLTRMVSDKREREQHWGRNIEINHIVRNSARQTAASSSRSGCSQRIGFILPSTSAGQNRNAALLQLYQLREISLASCGSGIHTTGRIGPAMVGSPDLSPK